MDPGHGPQFIIGGAPRSGTTWLYHVLARHPDVYLAEPARPEPKFFLTDELYERGLAYYVERWFAGAPPAAVKGEKSTNYLESPVAAERIAKHLPEIKLIFVLREPADRAYSNYLWSRVNGLESESFSVAIAQEPERERNCPKHLRLSRPHAYVSRGMYADLLAAYFERFSREQVLCLRFEDLVGQPQASIAHIHRFLDVQPSAGTAGQVARLNATRAGNDNPVPEVLALRERFTEPNRRLKELLGPDFEIWT